MIIRFILLELAEKIIRELEVISGTQASFTLSSDHLYVRAKITSNKLKANPFREGEYETAWTQPVEEE